MACQSLTCRHINSGHVARNISHQCSITPGCCGCRFFMFWALLFLCHQFGLSLYRFISTLARNIVVANAAGMMLLLCVLLMNGFLIQRRYLHPWVLWSVSLLLSLIVTATLAVAFGFSGACTSFLVRLQLWCGKSGSCAVCTKCLLYGLLADLRLAYTDCKSALSQ